MFNLKKVISSVAALAIVASSASAFAITFPDVEETASYVPALNVLTGLGIVNGDDNGLFNPENEVTRAEFTKMAVEALGEGEAATSQTTSKFNDAANTSVHWAAGYVAQGVADGFIDGYDDTTFGPDDKVTFAQACKMLVAALGYTTYAENAGGWPAGYVAQASSTGVSKGVSVGNDTNLTRAECAILVYNALQTPLCMLAGYTPVASLDGGYVQAPRIRIYDGASDDGSAQVSADDYRTLLTTRHDAYAVKGRVMATPKSEGALERDEVRFRVELAENFNDLFIDPDAAANPRTSAIASRTQRMYVGETDAADMMFEYAKAIVLKDGDADKYTILTIEKFGESKSVSFSADDVDLTKFVAPVDPAAPVNAAGETQAVNNIVADGKIEVSKSKSSSSTTKYNFSDDVAMYVNGQEVGSSAHTAAGGWFIPDAGTGAIPAMSNLYIDNNKAGTVTLIDATDPATTSTDGYYDFIMVDHYIDAVVSSVQAGSTSTKIYTYGTSGPTNFSSIKWDSEDDDVSVTIKNAEGEDIAATDLNEFDILMVKASPGLDFTDIGTRQDDDFADIVVSTNAVEGKMTSADNDDITVDIDGTTYDAISRNLVDTNKYETNANNELNSEYTFYFDAFGYVAWVEEGKTSATYGLVAGMYKSTDGSAKIAKIITGDGKVVAYECKTGAGTSKDRNGNSVSAEQALYDALTGAVGTVNNAISKDTAGIGARITSGQTFVSYKLSGGKITNVTPIAAITAINGEYKASTTKVDGATISDASSQIINLEDYISDDDVSSMAVADFVNEDTYTGFAYRKPGSSSSAYNFVVILSGLSTLGEKTPLAVVAKRAGTTLATDDQECTKYIVAVNGQEEQEVLFDTALGTAFGEGDVIQYVVGSKGYVDQPAKFNLVVDAAVWAVDDGKASYTSLFDATVAQADFNNMITDQRGVFGGFHANSDTDGNPANGIQKPEDSLTFGIVYKQQGNNLEMFLSQAANESAIANVFDFSTSGVNLYKVDYTNKVKYRVEVGGISQASSIFTSADLGGGTYVRNPNTDTVNWVNAKAQQVAPSFALVRIYDNDEADVVYYTGEF